MRFGKQFTKYGTGGFMAQNFIGREDELNALRGKFNIKGFQMITVFGRRRVGKTTLINRFIEETDCKAISFAAVERSESELLSMMSSEVISVLSPGLEGIVSFESFDKLFDFIAKAAEKERIIFLIDEYPYLAKACSYMNSLLQKYADHAWKNTQLYFILCGSLVSFMRDEVLSKNAPLYGRSTLEFQLKPLDYLTSSYFLPGYTREEQAIVYGLTGGVPKYLEQFDPDLTLDENIAAQFYSSNGYFTEEQIKTVITDDRQTSPVYYEIIAALASGRTRHNEICQYAKIDDATHYLNVMVSSGLIEKRKSKTTYYVLNDGMLKFYFNYVSRAASLINAGRGNVYYEKHVKPELHNYMGSVFENMAKQYIYRNAGTDRVPAFVSEVKDYQTSVRTDQGIVSIEIDIAGYDNDDFVLAGECKFQNKQFNEDELNKFLNKLPYVPAENPAVILFALSGFTAGVRKHKEITLVDIKEMYRP